MNAKTKCHFQALRETLELAMVGGMIALIADAIWVTHDIMVNGLNTWYIIIAVGLGIGNYLTAKALYHHHKTNIKNISHSKLQVRLQEQKKRTRYLRKAKVGMMRRGHYE